MKNFMKRDNEVNNEVLKELKGNVNQSFNSQMSGNDYPIQNNSNELCMNTYIPQAISIVLTDDGILDNKAIRENLISKTEVLDKVKGLILLSNIDYCTPKMVAEYFEVDYDAIDSCIRRNQEELIDNGLIRKTGKEIKDMIINVTVNMTNTLIESNKSGFKYDNETFRNNTNTLLNRRVILNIAMLLRDSIVARKIRKVLLDLSETEQGKQSMMNSIEQIEQMKYMYASCSSIMERLDLYIKYSININNTTKSDLLKLLNDGFINEKDYKSLLLFIK